MKIQTKLITLGLTLLLAGAVVAGDNLWQGADNQPNAKSGPVTYSRLDCWDGTYYDRATCTGGALDVNVSGTSGLPVYVDDADWTDSTSTHMLGGCIYQSTPQTITDGDTGPLQCDANGNFIESNSALIKALIQGYGNYNYNDLYTAVADEFAMVGGVYQSTPQVIPDGDVGPIQLTTNGYMITSDENGSDIKTAVEKIDDAVAGSEMQCDIVADGAGLATSANQTTANSSLSVMDDWESGDDADKANVLNSAKQVDADNTSQCVAITASDADFTLPTGSNYFRICSYGNTAYLNCADSTPAVDHTVGSFSIAVADGQCHEFRITETTCAVIGVSAAGFVCFYNYLH